MSYLSPLGCLEPSIPSRSHRLFWGSCILYSTCQHSQRIQTYILHAGAQNKAHAAFGSCEKRSLFLRRAMCASGKAADARGVLKQKQEEQVEGIPNTYTHTQPTQPTNQHTHQHNQHNQHKRGNAERWCGVGDGASGPPMMMPFQEFMNRPALSIQLLQGSALQVQGGPALGTQAHTYPPRCECV